MAVSGLGSGVGARFDYTKLEGGAGELTGAVQVLRIAVEGETCDVTDISSAGSTDAFSEFLPGLVDPGSITVTLRYGSTVGTAADNTFDELQTLFELREIGTYKITIPGTATWECLGFMTRLGIAVHYKGGVQQQVTVKCTGAPTFTPAS